MRKVFVEVVVRYSTDGRKTPLYIKWEDGRKFIIDKVIGSAQAASLKAGGRGTRYRCRICGKETHLWQDDDGKWFVEAK